MPTGVDLPAEHTFVLVAICEHRMIDACSCHLCPLLQEPEKPEDPEGHPVTSRSCRRIQGVILTLRCEYQWTVIARHLYEHAADLRQHQDG